MEKFTTDHLTETQFEEYCFDLLKAMGFVNVQWRKGTGLTSSPSDQGRDIECEYVRTEIDGAVLVERWFVECKHYKQGVPPAKISGAIAWAEAESPDCLLLIASNFFSNPTKEYLEKYKANRKPAFRIKRWELPDLKENSNGKLLLLSKYGLTEELAFLSIMHPAHLEYIKSIQLNTLDYLFECFDALETTKRDQITGWLWEPIIQPRYREPVNKNETLRQMQIDPTDYDIFKRTCYEIKRSGILSEILLTSLIVGFLLQAMFGHGNTSSIDQVMRRYKDTLEFMAKLEQADSSKRELVEKSRPRFEELMRETPDRIRDGHKLYIYFCEKVVVRLLQQRIDP
ncbi:hypothetical protein Amsp01_056430 [Amycolatopsis sp. NBRC 101858]|uniref:restriction endonuclease n=1 Tax=Amycolatopsis sp. NBRC 101858 TaxID=3032200 RepID=UPI0024A4382B|nr:restriction endonuclease [Amycolatopsis sp. NBRC 101858]GLY39619.1 hypothetical protein Amsp01_056430 [Amycolatopsis sp. NBRC 101858]